jgi:predicted helicase
MDVMNGLKEDHRGKVIAACGTGKTLTALWISERLNARSVLFVAPSLALIQQTLREWSDQASVPFRYQCICSDRTVVSEDDNRFADDIGDIAVEEADFPVTTSTSPL